MICVVKNTLNNGIWTPQKAQLVADWMQPTQGRQLFNYCKQDCTMQRLQLRSILITLDLTDRTNTKFPFRQAYVKQSLTKLVRNQTIPTKLSIYLLINGSKLNE